MKTIDVSKIDFVKLGPDDRRAVERRDRRRERLAVRIESRIRWLVMFLRGRGGQSQFSVRLSARLAERNGPREVQAWIADHPDGDLSGPTLARQARMSARNFAHNFHREIATTPAAYVEAQACNGTASTSGIRPGGAGAVGGSSESSRYVMPRIALCCLHAARRSVPSAPAAALSSRETTTRC